MTWPAEQRDPWGDLDRRMLRRCYPSAEVVHLEYRRLVTDAAARLGISEREYVRNLFEWGHAPGGNE